MKRFKVSAPGKLHILGEHAVVYGKPAILAAVDKRCFIEISTREDEKIKVTSKNYEKNLAFSFNEIVEKFNKAQKDWDNYDKSNDIPLLKSITKEPLDYPFIIIGQFIKYYDLDSLPGFDLVIDSEVPVGAGMGSSGALSVSVVGALSLLIGKSIDKETVNEIAYLCEKKKHGKPSGGDNSTSVYGGFIKFQKEEGVKVLDFEISKDVSKNFYIINTGIPTESTGEMVSLVRGQFERDQRVIQDIMDDQERLVNKLYVALEKNRQNDLRDIIKKGETNLEKLEVVSDYVKKLIRDIEINGGVAKICGGGGITKATGIVLVYSEKDNLEDILTKYELKLEKVILGCEGLRIDE